MTSAVFSVDFFTLDTLMLKLQNLIYFCGELQRLATTLNKLLNSEKDKSDKRKSLAVWRGFLFIEAAIKIADFRFYLCEIFEKS